MRRVRVVDCKPAGIEPGLTDIAGAAEYHYPPDKPVSDACKDLLSKIFVVEPEDRITISEIWRHPWFQENLPPVFDMDRYNDYYLKLPVVRSCTAFQPSLR